MPIIMRQRESIDEILKILKLDGRAVQDIVIRFAPDEWPTAIVTFLIEIEEQKEIVQKLKLIGDKPCQE